MLTCMQKTQGKGHHGAFSIGIERRPIFETQIGLVQSALKIVKGPVANKRVSEAWSENQGHTPTLFPAQSPRPPTKAVNLLRSLCDHVHLQKHHKSGQPQLQSKRSLRMLTMLLELVRREVENLQKIKITSCFTGYTLAVTLQNLVNVTY